MKINDSKRIKDIQEEFSSTFPYLRLRFYAHPHPMGKGSPVREQLDENVTIAQARRTHNAGDLVISPQMTVADFERKFFEKFGLSVQVFRKSGEMWMQTTATDGWTLTEQNRKGASSEEAFIEKYGS